MATGRVGDGGIFPRPRPRPDPRPHPRPCSRCGDGFRPRPAPTGASLNFTLKQKYLFQEFVTSTIPLQNS